MKYFAFAAVASLVVLPASLSAAAPATLNNVDVVQMVRSGVSVEEIRAKICSSRPEFLLQNGNLLTTMGVPPTILETMELRQNTGSCEPRPVASYTPPAAAAAPGSSTSASSLEKLQVPAKKRSIFTPWAKRK